MESALWGFVIVASAGFTAKPFAAAELRFARGVDSKRLKFQGCRPSNFQEVLQRDVGWVLVIQDQTSEREGQITMFLLSS